MNTLADLIFFFNRELNAKHEFSCTRNSVYMQLKYTIVTVRANCEGLFVLGSVYVYHYLYEFSKAM